MVDTGRGNSINVITFKKENLVYIILFKGAKDYLKEKAEGAKQTGLNIADRTSGTISASYYRVVMTIHSEN